MPRVVWSLLHGRPTIEVVLTQVSSGQPVSRRFLADTGAGSIHSRHELLLVESDCSLYGSGPTATVRLSGAYTGSCNIYVLRVQIPALGFDDQVDAAGVPALPRGFGGIACFRFLNRFHYGNFGDPSQFGLET
jgi:hypothetical protein